MATAHRHHPGPTVTGHRSMSAVDDDGRGSPRPQPGAELLGQRHRAVPPARAAQGDGQVRLALLDEGGQEQPHQVVDPVEEGPGGLLAHDEVPHGLVEPRQGTQLLHPVGIGQEPAVEDEVGVEGQAVLVPERHHRHAHARLRVVAEEVGDPLAQLVDVELGRVDHDVGPGPHGLEEPALVGDGLGHLAFQDGVAPAGALEAPHQDVLGGVEIDELDAMALGP